ncbi:hypothetical protein [Sphingomonas sp. Leaf4]|uniref:hypothetical protein n=1 Tax=Sphingomonas sp. Leaf4 TaxID=2876553 RepID=UPI001E2FCD07|nr:hypothetical protein [Sphingomonas sp. Leaf4]
MTGFLDKLATWLGGPLPPATDAPGPTPVPARAGIQPDDPRLPDTSRPLVARLLGLIDDLEARAGRDAVLIATLTEIRQMRDDHLPRLIASYAEIPPAHRAEIFRQTGRSASYKLNQGIERMVERLQTLSRSLAQDDLDSFADNLRFIERRYGDDDPAR